MGDYYDDKNQQRYDQLNNTIKGIKRIFIRLFSFIIKQKPQKK